MPPPDQCSECRYSRVANTGQLECRKLPAKAFIKQTDHVITCFPKVSETDWCGEFMKKTT